MPFNIQQTTKDYIEHINKLNDKLIHYAENIKFKTIDLKQFVKSGKLPEEVGRLENCIYFIRLNNMKANDAENICKHINELKSSDKTTKYPRINSLTPKSKNDILYIGKSKGKLQARFKSHLTATPKSTYGLHIDNWVDQFKHLNFQLYYAQVDLDKEDIDSDILEILESGLHLQAKPLLGRSGH